MDNSHQSNPSTVNRQYSSFRLSLILIFYFSEGGSIVWCKYKKYPYWPGIIWEKITKSTRTQYDILFFGTFSLGM